METELTPDEITFIRSAARYLERPSFVVKMTNLVGRPFEVGLALLPVAVKQEISRVTQLALEKALATSIATLRVRKVLPGISNESLDFRLANKRSTRTHWIHTALTAVTGAAGGFFGLASLPLELPITTGLMLRSIASIAASYGHDVENPQIRLECLSVFAMGSTGHPQGEVHDSAYFAARVTMSRLLDQTAEILAKKTAKELAEAIAGKSAPLLGRFLTTVASRFEVVVSEKVVAEAIPGIGAITGAAVNSVFSDHFNLVAKYHFGLLALEKKAGPEAVRLAYSTSR